MLFTGNNLDFESSSRYYSRAKKQPFRMSFMKEQVMNKALIFPLFCLVFLLPACGIPVADHTKVVNELAVCGKQRDESAGQVNACRDQAKNLTAENDSLKKDKDALQKENQGLQGKVTELSAKAEKTEQLEKTTQTYQDLQKKLEREIQDGQVQLTEMKNRLTMTMVDKILFASGSADVSKEGKQVLDKVITILKDISDKRIQVEGHTDNVRIYSSIKTRYPTNWELSTARATQVVRYLQEDGGLDPKALSATGYSEYQPLAANDTDENKAKNRRIEIVLLPLLK
jgi:chemotaxis protein MotB